MPDPVPRHPTLRGLQHLVPPPSARAAHARTAMILLPSQTSGRRQPIQRGGQLKRQIPRRTPPHRL